MASKNAVLAGWWGLVFLWESVKVQNKMTELHCRLLMPDENHLRNRCRLVIGKVVGVKDTLENGVREAVYRACRKIWRFVISRWSAVCQGCGDYEGESGSAGYRNQCAW